LESANVRFNNKNVTESRDTQIEVTANRPDIVIKNKKEKTCCRDTTNLVPEMQDYTSYNWSHRNRNKRSKEIFTFNLFQ